ncbi:permease [Amycolatopsis anabasis]|uniref:permease n=1 Tax=Amycolatopsis anabasis TaxID=1840409 RepID=UPI00131AA53D|nr:permease [Amycolatopsis anabasis]
MHSVLEVLRIAGENLLALAVFFFIALAIAALVDLFYLDVVARRSFKKHGLLGILFTTCLGAFSPFCSFTVIPLIRKLLRGGVPLSAVMSFWIASPAMDPPIYALTAKQIGVPLATARLLGALILAMGAGLLIYALERRGHFTDVLRPEAKPAERLGSEQKTPQPATVAAAAGGAAPASAPATSAPSCADSGCGAADPDEDDGAPWWPQAKASLRSGRNWRVTGRNFLRDTFSLGKWLAFACVFEGVIRVYVPSGVVTDFLGGTGLLAIPLAALISVPFYLNGVGAIPIVGGLLSKGMAEGAAVTFLLAGSITTIPAMVAVRSVVNNKVFALYLIFGVLGSIVLGGIAQLVL